MNKAEFIAAIAEKSGMAKDEVEKSFFSATFETMAEALVKQAKIAIPRFGSFATKVREERKGRNPSTGREITIPRTMVANFKAAAQLKEIINNSQSK